MGAQHSSDRKGDCHCFALKSPFRRNINSNDPLGSPLPDTPKRKKREFSSRYGGLEKEVSSLPKSSISDENKSRTANVHEGLVSVCAIVAYLAHPVTGNSFSFLKTYSS